MKRYCELCEKHCPMEDLGCGDGRRAYAAEMLLDEMDGAELEEQRIPEGEAPQEPRATREIDGPEGHRPPPHEFDEPEGHRLPPHEFGEPEGHRPPLHEFERPEGHRPPPREFGEPEGHRPPPHEFGEPEGHRPPPHEFGEPEGYRPPPHEFGEQEGHRPPPHQEFDELEGEHRPPHGPHDAPGPHHPPFPPHDGPGPHHPPFPPHEGPGLHHPPFPPHGEPGPHHPPFPPHGEPGPHHPPFPPHGEPGSHHPPFPTHEGPGLHHPPFPPHEVPGPHHPPFPPHDGFGPRGPHPRPPRFDPEELLRQAEGASTLELFDMCHRALHRPDAGAMRGQGRALAILAARGEMSQRELQDALRVAPGSMSELIAKLERKGMLTRERGGDKRSNLLKITDAGREAAAQVKAPGDELLSALSDDQRGQFAATLKLLLADWLRRGERTPDQPE